MDAPGLPSFQFDDGFEGIDCTRTSGLSMRLVPLSLMGFAGRLLNRFLALEVPQTLLGFANHGLTCLAITA